jgi:hypothetical protein
LERGEFDIVGVERERLVERLGLVDAGDSAVADVVLAACGELVGRRVHTGEAACGIHRAGLRGDTQVQARVVGDGGVGFRVGRCARTDDGGETGIDPTKQNRPRAHPLRDIRTAARVFDSSGKK